MSFFDTTPTGRILSRFSRDIYTVDNEIADSLDIFVYIILQLTVVMVTIMMITPFCEYMTLLISPTALFVCIPISNRLYCQLLLHCLSLEFYTLAQ
jgi:ABC-type multidrug transport system fused ATPase/permease subunit